MRQDFDEMPAMLSAIRVAGMWSCCNSQTVRRAPCGKGRGSSAKTSTFLPDSTAARITPSAVPWPAVDSAPSLQREHRLVVGHWFPPGGLVDGDILAARFQPLPGQGRPWQAVWVGFGANRR